MKFNIQTDGNDAARILATAWAERMQFMFDAHKDGLMGSPAAIAKTMAGNQPNKDFVLLAASATGQ
eukprot:6062121-Lingulodinium_polyedra.AAC.1